MTTTRVARLMQHAIDSLRLDLSGLTVLTEAATGAYVCTPAIAVLAGAKRVLALTADSKHGTAAEVIRLTRRLERCCGIPNTIEVFEARDPDLFSAADIVTNLGFVRPIDAEVVAVMKPTAVVTLMCEAWEYRTADVDVDTCKRRGISVGATDEEHPAVNVFSYSGALCAKMLFDAAIEVHKSSIIIVSSDKFGRFIATYLSQAGASVHLTSSLRDVSLLELGAADALVVADYSRSDVVIGAGGDRSAESLADAAPGLTVLQFAGRIDAPALKQCGLTVYPGVDLEPHRMALTLAALGPRPVIELHTAGLKVGQLLSNARLRPSSLDQDPYAGLVQRLRSDDAIHESTL